MHSEGQYGGVMRKKSRKERQRMTTREAVNEGKKPWIAVREARIGLVHGSAVAY